MKKLQFLFFGVLISLLLFGCSTNNATEYKIGETADYQFGTLAITGFKRDQDNFYFSYKFIPEKGEKAEIPWEDFRYRYGDENTYINESDETLVTLEGTPIQDMITISTPNSPEIDGILFTFKGKNAIWTMETSAESGGDISYIDSVLEQQKQKAEEEAQQKAQQEAQAEAERQQKQAEEEAQAAQAQAQKALKDEELDARTYGSEAVENYGEQLYPYGFTFHYLMGMIAQEKLSDGSWFLKAECTITNMYGADYDSVCEATVVGSGENWTVTDFYVYS